MPDYTVQAVKNEALMGYWAHKKLGASLDRKKLRGPWLQPSYPNPAMRQSTTCDSLAAVEESHVVAHHGLLYQMLPG